MSQFILALLSAVRVFFRSRHDAAPEILALRQQVAVLKRNRPRPRLNPWDRLFWTTLRRVWFGWTDVLKQAPGAKKPVSARHGGKTAKILALLRRELLHDFHEWLLGPSLPPDPL